MEINLCQKILKLWYTFLNGLDTVPGREEEEFMEILLWYNCSNQFNKRNDTVSCGIISNSESLRKCWTIYNVFVGCVVPQHTSTKTYSETKITWFDYRFNYVDNRSSMKYKSYDLIWEKSRCDYGIRIGYDWRRDDTLLYLNVGGNERSTCSNWTSLRKWMDMLDRL